MTFSYDTSLTDAISVVRFYIGDAIENEGPRPGPTTNYSDEEITGILTLYDSNVDVSIVRLFEALAAEWTKLAVSYTIGPRREELYRVADMYKKRATEWSVVAGLSGSAFSSGVIRRGPFHADSEHTS